MDTNECGSSLTDIAAYPLSSGPANPGSDQPWQAFILRPAESSRPQVISRGGWTRNRFPG